MACSGSLTARLVSNDDVRAETICSIAHVCYEVLAWSGAALRGRPE